MLPITWAFIFLEENADPLCHHQELSCNDRILIYGVSSVSEGAELAKELVLRQNCQLIELCGGFGAAGAKSIFAAVNKRIAVGYIEYLPEAQSLVQALLSDGGSK